MSKRDEEEGRRGRIRGWIGCAGMGAAGVLGGREWRFLSMNSGLKEVNRGGILADNKRRA
jgi:hypothetical protein